LLLAIDVGNTNISVGAFDGETLAHQWRLSTRADASADELGVLVRGIFETSQVDIADIDAVILSSVVPRLDRALERMCTQYVGVAPMVVGPGIRTGVQIRYDNPKEVGADRVVNGLAAFRKYGGPAIVIDFGTSTNFDAIAENGDFIGGAIAPGINISMDALFERAAKLTRVDLQAPRSVIGKNTVESIQSGFLYGFVGQIEGIVERMKVELGPNCKVIATGGLAELISSHAKGVDMVDDRLTLDGLRFIHELNITPS
jgi:type III pantothenate kinase